VLVAYNIGLISLALLTAVIITAIGLGVAACSDARWAAPIGGAIVGLGVAGMHYIGMWAIEVPGHVTWSMDLVAASILIGMLFGMAALALAIRDDGLAYSITAAALLTLAIVSHHFIAMGAASIIPDPGRSVSEFSLSPASLAVAI